MRIKRACPVHEAGSGEISMDDDQVAAGSVERIDQIWYLWNQSCHNNEGSKAIFHVKLFRLKSYFSS